MPPALPTALVDAHHHLWRRVDVPAAGILAAPYLRRDFAWEDLERVAGALTIEASCCVQVRDDVAEVQFVEEVAAAHQRLGAMIPWAPLEDPGVGAVLDDLTLHPLVRGVRRSTQHEADPEFVARPEFVAGARRLGPLGLVLELCVRHRQLAAAPRLAEACPETTIVVEHLGKPDVKGPPPCEWLRTMEQLGGLPNVWCKVSPVVHAETDPAFTLSGQAPFVEHAIECFGWQRVVFGSNWPVATAVVSYSGWVAMLAEILSGAPPERLKAFYAGNARRLYRLPARA